jgi:hypothetical protein
MGRNLKVAIAGWIHNQRHMDEMCELLEWDLLCRIRRRPGLILVEIVSNEARMIGHIRERLAKRISP